MLSSADRQNYIRKINKVLKDKGILFLKCLSDKEPRLEGPYKFSQYEIRELFNESFRIDNIKRNCLSRDFGSTPKGIICCYDKSIVKKWKAIGRMITKP